jgi:hypothetical protein
MLIYGLIDEKAARLEQELSSGGDPKDALRETVWKSYLRHFNISCA